MFALCSPGGHAGCMAEKGVSAFGVGLGVGGRQRRLLRSSPSARATCKMSVAVSVLCFGSF